MVRTRSGKVYSIAPTLAPLPPPSPKEDLFLETMRLLRESPTTGEARDLSPLSYTIYMISKTGEVASKLKYCRIAENIILSGGSRTIGHVSPMGDTALQWVISVMDAINGINGRKLDSAEWVRLNKNLIKLAHSIITYTVNATEFEQRNSRGVSPLFWALRLCHLDIPIDMILSLRGIIHHILRKYAKKRWSTKHLELTWSSATDPTKKYTTNDFLTSDMRDFIKTKCVC